MTIPDDLLLPIEGTNPSGKSLRFDPVYDQIKEARREEVELSMGDWQRERKKADSRLAIRLCIDALTHHTKDLHLAAWLTEALVRAEGFSGLVQGLSLVRGLLEAFWDTIYPEIEEGDTEFRAAPLEWLGTGTVEHLRRVPLTKGSLDWFKFLESRKVGYAKDVDGHDERVATRDAAIKEGKITGEDFDAAVKATPKSFYVQLVEDQQCCLEAVESLDRYCDGKFGRNAPSFGPLRDTLQEVQRTSKSLLEIKLEQEPDKRVEPETEPPESHESQPEDRADAQPIADSASWKVAPQTVKLADPEDVPDALQRAAGLAEYLRGVSPYSPISYLLVRALRWGELRSNGTRLDPAQMEAPPSEIRRQLRQLAAEGEWPEVLRVAEDAMAEPCGRAWLDLHRYTVRAMRETDTSYEPCWTAIESELKALLATYPALPEMSLDDETPAANAETKEWIQQLVAAPKAAEVLPEAPRMDQGSQACAKALEVDALDLAKSAIASGNRNEALKILTSQLSQEHTGRGRFQRKVQMARLCMDADLEQMALPMLQSLASELDDRRLEEWEAREFVGYPLSLLLRCTRSVRPNQEQESLIYGRLCQLDPMQALEHGQ